MPPERRPVAEHAWRAMGCDVSVAIVGNRPDLIEVAVDRIEDLEDRWSRFRSHSEVSELNRRAGEPVSVTADTRLLVQTSIEASEATGGRFDPMVGEAVIAAGYDRTIEEVQSGAPVVLGPAVPSAGCREIRVDVADGAITLPAGARFDPGGLGKGLAADLLATELVAAGAMGACVNIGGDVRVVGLGPDIEDGDELGWTIGIADPFAPGRDAVVATLADGAVATSSTLKRRWQTESGHDAHHLIDPRTGSPSTSSVVTATVIAANGATAEALATASIIAGVEAAVPMIEALSAAALLVEADGTRTVAGAFEAFLVQPFPLESEVPADEDPAPCEVSAP